MDPAKTIAVRRATANDFPQIVDLQWRNLGTNLSSAEQADGFLSGYFDIVALQAANEDVSVVVCTHLSKIAGFICLTTPSFKYSNDVALAMLEAIRDGEIFGKSFNQWKVCLCGPVCIEREYRGVGAFAKMYERIPEYAKGLDLLVTLIATKNTRSIAAHQKVGLSKIADFEWNERTFIVLARTV